MTNQSISGGERASDRNKIDTTPRVHHHHDGASARIPARAGPSLSSGVGTPRRQKGSRWCSYGDGLCDTELFIGVISIGDLRTLSC
ncbi:hypothetical protein JTB14_009203 [Gonioctena quinquepunctata]|nr:hypothetical protein JTB14_009203 [Gonioctena quinquepunctata]